MKKERGEQRLEDLKASRRKGWCMMLAITSELTFMVPGLECEIYQRSKQTILHVSSRHPIRPSATSPASSISGSSPFVSARVFKPRDEAIEAEPRMITKPCVKLHKEFKHGAEHGIIFNGGAVPATLTTFSLSDSQALSEGDTVSWPITAGQHYVA